MLLSTFFAYRAITDKNKKQGSLIDISDKLCSYAVDCLLGQSPQFLYKRWTLTLWWSLVLQKTLKLYIFYPPILFARTSTYTNSKLTLTLIFSKKSTIILNQETFHDSDQNTVIDNCSSKMHARSIFYNFCIDPLGT